MLFQHGLRQLRSRQPGIIAFIFGEVLHAAKFFDREHILGRLPVQPLGIDIQAARRLLRGAVVQFLPLAGFLLDRVWAVGPALRARVVSLGALAWAGVAALVLWLAVMGRPLIAQ